MKSVARNPKKVQKTFCLLWLCLAFLLPLPCVTAQNQVAQPVELTGTWSGTLSQNPHRSNMADSYPISMTLRQNGIFLRGTAYVSFRDHFAELKLSGHQLENGSWLLQETEMLRASDLKEIGRVWCYKGYELLLNYTPGGLTLSGPWWGEARYENGQTGACIPGAVQLFRRKPGA